MVDDAVLPNAWGPFSVRVIVYTCVHRGANTQEREVRMRCGLVTART